MHSAGKSKLSLRHVAAGIMASGLFGCLVAGESERQRLGVAASALDECLCASPQAAGMTHACTACRRGYAVTLPRDVSPATVSMASTDRLHVGGVARVSGASGASGLLTSMGGGETRIDSCARVTGDISSEPSVTVSPGATVSGAIRTGGDVTPANTLSWFVSFPRVAGSEVIVSRGTKRELQPGNYGGSSRVSGCPSPRAAVLAACGA
jgi:hypothetical protein